MWFIRVFYVSYHSFNEFFRCAMNAFLAVPVIRLPIKSFEDIENKKMTIVLWGGDLIEDFLKTTRVYQLAKKDGRILYINSTGKGLTEFFQRLWSI